MAAGIIGLIDLASEDFGGKALYCNDEFFAEKENLLKFAEPIFIDDKYTDRGKWMDGWETRRKREIGHDWVVIKLGIPGIIRALDLNTAFFKGNNAAYAAIDACQLKRELKPNEKIEENQWQQILEQVPLRPDSHNIALIQNDQQFDHVRLRIYPDGGVARFRVMGEVRPNLDPFNDAKSTIDLACITNGAKALACSDMFFSHMDNLIMPHVAKNMGDGWETKRRRGAGFDWVIVKLAYRGIIEKLVVNTMHFKGNFPDRCMIEYCDNSNVTLDSLINKSENWKPLLQETKLQADKEHIYSSELTTKEPATHLRLNIYPDGGVSRLRAFGRPLTIK